MRRAALCILGFTTLALVAGVAVARDKGRDASREQREEQEERIGELYRANSMALWQFIYEANSLQEAIKADGEASVKERQADWEKRVRKWLGRKLAPMYAADFDKARYTGAAPPKLGVAYEDLEAKKRALHAFMDELRKPD